mmetsp:Transcript_2229/g.3833  ORF Transcript_2229/g.3833 Transcript_2229/m.3833 type:complete len:413 (-) Transcript_2229:1301-2539(-)
MADGGTQSASPSRLSSSRSSSFRKWLWSTGLAFGSSPAATSGSSPGRVDGVSGGNEDDSVGEGERQHPSDPEPPLGEKSGIDWVQFESEEKAAHSLLTLAESYRNAAVETARVGTMFSKQLLMFFSNSASSSKRSAATRIHQMMIELEREVNAERYNVDVVDRCRVLVERFSRVREMNKAKREMHAAVQRCERIHYGKLSASSSRAVSEETLGQAAQQLKIAINRYCELEKNVVDDVEYIHNNFDELASPTLLGFIEAQLRLSGTALTSSNEAKKDYLAIDHDDNFKVSEGERARGSPSSPKSPQSEISLHSPGKSMSTNDVVSSKASLRTAPLVPGNLALELMDDDSLADSDEPERSYSKLSPPTLTVKDDSESSGGEEEETKSAASFDSLRHSRTMEWEDQQLNLTRIEL